MKFNVRVTCSHLKLSSVTLTPLMLTVSVAAALLIHNYKDGINKKIPDQFYNFKGVKGKTKGRGKFPRGNQFPFL